ncbi:hypothetical protein D1872_269830 [compost metagenome]
MISQVAGVIIQQIHGLVYRVNLPLLQRVYLGYIVAQRIALNEIPVIEQQAIRCLFTSRLD